MEHTSAENAKNDVLQSIDKMVRKVKEDGEVSLEYMKIFEREEMLIKQGVEQGIKQGITQGISQGIIQGQEMERRNTEKERQRADAAEQELKRLREELARLRE